MDSRENDERVKKLLDSKKTFLPYYDEKCEPIRLQFEECRKRLSINEKQCKGSHNVMKKCWGNTTHV